MRLGIIGAGQMGGYYSRILVERLGVSPDEIVVHDTHVDRAQKLAGQYGMQVSEQLPADLDAAIVVVNTPAHADVITRLAPHTSKILCEKPLGLDRSHARRIVSCVSNDQLFMALVMNFSPALTTLREFIGEHALVPLELRGSYGKPRLLDKNVRPSPGVIDEVIHPISMALSLLPKAERKTAFTIYARSNTLLFVDPAVQRKACEEDASFPRRPPHSVSAMITVHQDGGRPIPIDMYSSFMHPKQERHVGGVLGRDDEPAYIFGIDLDRREGESFCDELELIDLVARKRHVEQFPNVDKLRMVAESFLNVVRGGVPDPRLADVHHAALLVEFNDKLIASSNVGMSQRIEAQL